MCNQEIKTTTSYIVRRTERSGRVSQWEMDDRDVAIDWARRLKQQYTGCIRVTIAEVQKNEMPEYDV